MNHLKPFNDFQKVDESFKSWVATFLLLANLGLAPAHVVAGTQEDKKEFVEDIKNDPQKYEAALFVDYLSKLGRVSDIQSEWEKFKRSNNLKSDFSQVKKYIERDGKQYRFNKKFTSHNYDRFTDIHKFTPDNWMTDLGSFIDDDREPDINNWISDYEKITSIEIGIITVDNLDGTDVYAYTQEQFNRLGVGKSTADNGLLIVVSKQDRKWRIHTGSGIEGILTDGECGSIGRDFLVPNFKNGDYYEGIMATLEAIKAELGTEGIEGKKAWLKQQDDRKQAEFNDKLRSVGDFLIWSSFIGLLIYLGYYIRNKAKLKKEEKERMIRRIDSLLDSIDLIRSKFPDQPELKNSSDLRDIHKLAKSIINETPIPPKSYSKETEISIGDIDAKIKRAYNDYSSVKSRLLHSIAEISGLPKLALVTRESVEDAIKAYNKIQELGYNSNRVDASGLDELDQKVSEIQSLVNQDLDKASEALDKIKLIATKIQGSSQFVIGSLGKIEGSIDRVKNWKPTVDSMYNKFKGEASSSEKDKAQRLISELGDKIGSSKDWVELDKEITSVISYMRGVLDKYESERRAEEERIRRKRREEEEEEDRRRRDSYSSSSSSTSSSFGGFGGGSSSGGGADGSW